MSREGAIIFRDLIGKLDVLHVECDKCGKNDRGRTTQPLCGLRPVVLFALSRR
jgi:hypothetical protein